MNLIKNVQNWKLGHLSNLENVITLLSKDYSQNVEGTSVFLNHSWSNHVSDNNDFKILDYNGEEQTYRYLPVFANVERIKDKQLIGQVSKEYFVTYHQHLVLFVEYFGSVLALVSAFTSNFPRIRSNLMRFKVAKNNLWGKVDFNWYKIDYSFFTWLISKKNSNINIGSEIFKLEDVTGFNSHSERILSKYSGTGKSIDTRPPVMTMISLQDNFDSLSLLLTNQQQRIAFSLLNSGETKIDFTESYKIKDKDNVEFFNFDDLVLKIYLQVIPALIKSFNGEEEWNVEERRFRKLSGLKTIKEIMFFNGISKEEII